MSRIASYLVQPDNVRFETQGKNEKIDLLLRKHPITQIPWIVFTLVLLVIPLIGVPLFLELNILPLFITGRLLVFLLFFWYLAVFGYMFMRFLLWFFNVNIVTDKRIVDIDFPFLLFKESTATRFEQVEDLTHRRGGFIRTIFNFGDVFIQTAGAKPNIEFLDVPQPAAVVRQIVNQWQQKRPAKARAFLARGALPA